MPQTEADARRDGYVECAECGHLIDTHDGTGCQGVDGCTCDARWTEAEILALRRRIGLPD
jgi:hypothetical protein